MLDTPETQSLDAAASGGSCVVRGGGISVVAQVCSKPAPRPGVVSSFAYAGRVANKPENLPQPSQQTLRRVG
jgi:hypothetical protein